MTLTDSQVLTGASAAFGVLASAIGVLWRSFLHTNKLTRDELLHCQTQHDESNKTVLKLTADVGELRGELVGVKMMSEAVLARIEAINGHKHK